MVVSAFEVVCYRVVGGIVRQLASLGSLGLQTDPHPVAKYPICEPSLVLTSPLHRSTCYNHQLRIRCCITVRIVTTYKAGGVDLIKISRAHI